MDGVVCASLCVEGFREIISRFSSEQLDLTIWRASGVMFAVDAGDLDDDEPDAWPEPEQRKLDASMRCSICQELFCMPVSFSTCTHTYCSLCIRRTLKEFKVECPTCRSPAKEEDLKPNHALEAVVGAYKAARVTLLTGARRGDDPTPARAKLENANGSKRKKGANISKPPAPSPDDGPPAKRTTRHASRNADTKKETPAVQALETRKATRSAPTGAEASTSGGVAPVVGGWGPTIRTSRRSPTPASPSDKETPDEEDDEDAGELGDEDYGETQEKDEDDDVVSDSELEMDDTKQEVVDLVRDEDDAGGGGGESKRKPSGRQPSAPSTAPGGADGKQRPGTVQCPICGVGVQKGLINSHVDVCLTRGGAFVVDDAEEQHMMAKLPKLVYHIMKDKPLRKLLTDAGLSTAGRRERLIDRHKEFTLRVNASVDSGHRPNPRAIAKEVRMLEQNRDRAGMMPAVGLAGSGGSGAAAAAAAAASKADVFGKLIADVKARGGKKRQSPVEESEEKAPARSPPAENSQEQEDPAFLAWSKKKASCDEYEHVDRFGFVKGLDY